MLDILLIVALITNCLISYSITHFSDINEIAFNNPVIIGLLIWLILSLVDICIYEFILMMGYKQTEKLNDELSKMRLRQLQKKNEIEND